MPHSDTTGLVLLIPAKPDIERDALARCWEDAGGEVVRLDRFWEPPNLDRAAVRIYGPDTFGLVLAQLLGLTLLEPDPRLPVQVPNHLVRRNLRIVPLEATERGTFPVFVKPVVPKQFTASVYPSADALRDATRGLEPQAELLVSEIVAIEAEARAFVLDGEAVDVAVYEGQADPSPIRALVTELAAYVALPEAVVVDFALTDGTWAFLEANAAWGAGLNGCDPKRVLPCVARATRRA